MPKVKIVFETRVDADRAGDLIKDVQATIDRFQDKARCMSRSKVGDLRCELDRDHEDLCCVKGIESWPNPNVVRIDGVTVPWRTKFRSNVSGATWILTGFDEVTAEAILERSDAPGTYRTGELWNKFDRL